MGSQHCPSTESPVIDRLHLHVCGPIHSYKSQKPENQPKTVTFCLNALLSAPLPHPQGHCSASGPLQQPLVATPMLKRPLEDCNLVRPPFTASLLKGIPGSPAPLSLSCTPPRPACEPPTLQVRSQRAGTFFTI